MARVGRDLKDHKSPTPCHTQGHQPPHFTPAQAAQGPIQPGLEHLQGWTGHPQPLWAAVPAPLHSLCKELPPDIQPPSSLCQLQTISPCPAVISPFQELIPLLFVGSLQVLKGCNPCYLFFITRLQLFTVYSMLLRRVAKADICCFVSAHISEGQWVPLFLHEGAQFHTSAPHTLPCQVPPCQMAPLLPTVAWQHDGTEHWWEGSGSLTRRLRVE